MTITTGRGELIRLHLSESPYGASQQAADAAYGALDQIAHYPDPDRARLTEAIADRLGVAAGQVVVGNGSDELVLLSSLSVGNLNLPGLTTAGTFPGYRICLQAVRRGCVEVPLAGTAVDVERFAAGMRRAGVAYLCNPHNPSGAAMSRDEMDLLVSAAARSGVPLVVDEAYHEFTPPGTPAVLDYLNGNAPLLALRTFSKAHGLAALRIGYAVGNRRLVSAVRRAQCAVPFSANRAGQAAALAALGDQGHLERVRQRNRDRRAWFMQELDRRGRRYLPSVTNFVAVEVAESASVEQRLAEDHGILVRDAGRFGFPGYVRVSLGELPDLRRLLDVLDELVPGHLTSFNPDSRLPGIEVKR